MKLATQDQIDAACLSRSADDAAVYLRDSGTFASRYQCARAIVRLNQDGTRKRMKTGCRIDPLTEEVIDGGLHAAVGCQRPLRRHIETGQHWINDPVRMASALRQSGMVA